MKDPVKDKLKRFGLFESFGEEVLRDGRRGRQRLCPGLPAGMVGLDRGEVTSARPTAVQGCYPPGDPDALDPVADGASGLIVAARQPHQRSARNAAT